MNSKLLGLGLFAATVAAVALTPYVKNFGSAHAVPPPSLTLQPVNSTLPAQSQNDIEVVFVLDTTGSMDGLLETAKEKIWSIASSMASANNAPTIKMGLVAYRDRGDDYVTRVTDLSSDLDSMYATLMEFQAEGGGDTPESVNQALFDAVHKISWSKDQRTYRTVFLVGDAPPHMDYANESRYPEILQYAKQQGIVVNTIQCGEDQSTTHKWKHVAQLAAGEYFQVEQSGGAVAIATPFDKALAALSRRLDGTRVFYGDAEKQKAAKAKTAATERLEARASVASKARRATFNVSASGAKNFAGEADLVEDIAAGRVDLSTVEREHLPASLRSLDRDQRKALVEQKAHERLKVKKEIQVLAKERQNYLQKKVAEQGGAKDSLDQKLYDAVRAQGARKGLVYETEEARF